MALKSKKKLFEFLADSFPVMFAGVEELGLTHPRVGNETYGRDSMIYLHWPDEDVRESAQWELEAEGFRVHPRYARGSGISQVQVSYFKGWHADE